MIEVAKALSNNQNFYSAKVIFPCPCAVYMYKILILLNNFSLKPLGQFSPNFISILLLKQDWEFVQIVMFHWLSCLYMAMMIIKNILHLQTQEVLKMMILSLVAMSGLEKCCITFAYLQWLFNSGERAVASGPLVTFFFLFYIFFFYIKVYHNYQIYLDCAP